MTNDALAPLPAEVREALSAAEWMDDGTAVDVIRAELLRLAQENARLQMWANGLFHRAERAEAELSQAEAERDALRKAIDEAPACTGEWTLAFGLTFMDGPNELDGKCVSLVVRDD